MTSSEGEPTLFGGQPRQPRQAPEGAIADPVARVVLDSPLAHIDRPFDYAVPEGLSDKAQPGVRVRVRWSGQLLDGYILERAEFTDHVGELAEIERVVSPEQVLTAHIATTARSIADYYGGTLSDVLRLAIPPRHANVEAEDAPVPSPAPPPWPRTLAWHQYDAGAAFLRRLQDGQAPAAAWLAAPGRTGAQDWPAALAEAARATVAGGRSAILVVPDHRDVNRVCSAVEELCGPNSYARLTADLGPGERYRSWLSVLRGQRSIVVGTRAASYAPVANLGLFAVWDDADDSLREQRTPYPHVLRVGLIRTRAAGAALLAGGLSRSTEVQQLVEDQTLRPIRPIPAVAQNRARVVVAGEGFEQERDAAARAARIPSLAWRVAKKALASGPVLVQVPRKGYGIGVSCARCREPKHCQRCQGPTVVPEEGGTPSCAWCGTELGTVQCAQCGDTQIRVAVVGDRRTAEEIGRAFPGVLVRQSRLGQVVERVSGEPAIVVATPGAEPVADTGYAGAILLDGWALLDRPGLEASTEATRRWVTAAALVKPNDAKAQVVLAGVPAHGEVRSVEALARWDPVWLARLELADREDLALPPVRRVATITGHPDEVAAAQEGSEPVAAREIEVLGPISFPDKTVAGESVPQAQAIWRASSGVPDAKLVRAVQELRVRRSMRRASRTLTITVDPTDVAT